MIFNEIKCHVNPFFSVGGDASPAPPPVSAPDSKLLRQKQLRKALFQLFFLVVNAYSREIQICISLPTTSTQSLNLR